MTTALWSRPDIHLSSQLEADVLIVGGGYVGLSTAYWLKELNPEKKIILLEGQKIGSGASGRNAGFLTKGSASFYHKLFSDWGLTEALSIYKYAQDSIDLVVDRILKDKKGIEFEATRSLTLFSDSHFYESVKKNKLDLSLFQFSWCDEKELPLGLRQNFVGAFENKNEYKINPMQLLELLRDQCLLRGVKIIESNVAYELVPSGLKTETHLIKASSVILALNGYSAQFHPAFKKYIFPHRAQMLAVELTEDLDSSALHYDPSERVYWRIQGKNKLLIGGKRLINEASEAGDYERISPQIQHALEDYLHEKIRVKFKILNRWAGIMGFTSTELPIISKVEAPLETLVVAGFSGHGMGLGFKAGQEAAEVILGLKDESYFSKFNSVDLKL
jgi:gamma-glutamylputrescine oxidase